MNRDALSALEAVIGRVVYLEELNETHGDTPGRARELRGMIAAAELLAAAFPEEVELAENRVADRAARRGLFHEASRPNRIKRSDKVAAGRED